MKGWLVFGDAERTVERAARYRGFNAADAFGVETLSHHPFGLVAQAGTMLYTTAYERSGVEEWCSAAVSEFEVAFERLSAGGPRLELLGHLAMLRREVFLAQAGKLHDKRRRGILNRLHILHGMS